MAYKIAIDSNDNPNLLSLSKYINDRLKILGLESFLVDNKSDIEKLNIIKNKYGNGSNIIIISNRLNNNNGIEIIYPLRSNSKLSSIIADNIENIGENVSKYYQKRDNNNPAYDEDYLIKNTNNNQTIVISYGNDTNSLFNNNIETLGEAIVKSIAEYANITYTPANLDGYYIVKKGDSLWTIATKTKTTVNELKNLNNLSSNLLQIGQILKLPNNDSNNSEITYIVKKGDSLWSIANRYDTTVDMIKNTNNLSSNLLSINQVLIIPSTSSFTNYTVQKGDSLYSISKKYNTTVDKIKSLNKLTSNLLQIGQLLTIPL